jgi:solute carrier family 35 (UDP-sugar transporter), member A1/2/3
LNYLEVAALPAALYALQNMLMLFGCDWLDAMSVNLLNQTKTLSAALFLYLILGQRQSPMQLFALFLMLLSAVILTNNSDSMNPFGTLNLGSIGLFSVRSSLANTTENTAVLGMLAIGAASMISGLSTALTQKALSKGRHAIFLSAELASFGIFSLIVTDMYQHNGQSTLLTLQGGGLFKHWSRWTLIPVFSSAVGGIIVGLVTKYAGGVTKGFALIAGIIVTGVAEFVVDGTPLGPKHIFAAGLVSMSIWIHSSFKYVAPSTKEKEN